MSNVLLRLAALSSKQALIFGGLLSLFYFFVLFDDGTTLNTKIAGIEAQIKTERLKEAESDAALKEIKAVQESVGALSEQFKIVSAQLPRDIQMAEIIRTVDKVAQTTGLNVKAKEPKLSIVQDVIEVMPLRVTAEGSFSEITMFFYYLSTIERIVRVKSFVLSTSADAKPFEYRNAPKVTLEADVVSYKFLPLLANKPDAKSAAGNVKP